MRCPKWKRPWRVPGFAEEWLNPPRTRQRRCGLFWSMFVHPNPSPTPIRQETLATTKLDRFLCFATSLSRLGVANTFSGTPCAFSKILNSHSSAFLWLCYPENSTF